MNDPAATGRMDAANRDWGSELASTFASEAAFRAFYDRALPRVYGYVYGRCGDPAVAEELTQLAFTSAVHERARFDGRSDPITWLIGIARHKLADHYRRVDRDERRRLCLIVREITSEADALAWQRLDEREAILRALHGLPALQRAVLVFHYADGLPVREIARRLGKSESATESLMTRAREAFRRAYGEPTDV